MATTSVHRSFEVLPAASSRAAGWGGLAFVVVVMIQNLVRATTAPLNNAPTAKVLAHYSQHSPVEMLLSVTFVVSGAGIALYVGGMARRLVDGPAPAWAYTGFAGALGVIALFSTLVGSEAALVGAGHRPHPNFGTIDALWLLHNAIFAVLDLSIAVALLGLGLAAVSAGLAPRVFSWLAPLGAALLAIGAAGAPVLADGSDMVFMAVALVGFVIWLAFVAVTGARLLREDQRGSSFRAAA
jgi:hypothetical protein